MPDPFSRVCGIGAGKDSTPQIRGLPMVALADRSTRTVDVMAYRPESKRQQMLNEPCDEKSRDGRDIPRAHDDVIAENSNAGGTDRGLRSARPRQRGAEIGRHGTESAPSDGRSRSPLKTVAPMRLISFWPYNETVTSLEVTATEESMQRELVANDCLKGRPAGAENGRASYIGGRSFAPSLKASSSCSLVVGTASGAVSTIQFNPSPCG